MNLKRLAKKAERFNGAVTFYLMPFHTNWTLDRDTKIEQLLGDDNEMTRAQSFYRAIMPLVVDIEFANGADENRHLMGLREYWKAHKDFDADDMERFSAYTSVAMWAELSSVLTETREELPSPSGILGEPVPNSQEDPKDLPDTGKM